mgnify:CR=1 FL=1
MKQLKIKKLNKNAVVPEKVFGGDVGLDLYTVERATIPPHGVSVISTGLAVSFPLDFYGEVRERSSISTKTPLSIKAGIIDSGYRGEIKIVVLNHGKEEFTVESGTKIAQLIVKKSVDIDVEEVDEFKDRTERSEKGFGSSN